MLEFVATNEKKKDHQPIKPYNNTYSKKAVDLTFKYETLEEWAVSLDIDMQANAKDLIHNRIVHSLDYLLNPSIKMKNFTVIKDLQDKLLPKLNHSKKDFEEIQLKVKELKN